MIGFDPIVCFGQVQVEDGYLMNVWAQTNSPLPSIQFPIDPNDASRRLPHCAHVDFGKYPIRLVPTSILLQWLYYHGVPMNKSTTKSDIIQQVQRAIDIDQPLDEDLVLSRDACKMLSTSCQY